MSVYDQLLAQAASGLSAAWTAVLALGLWTKLVVLLAALSALIAVGVHRSRVYAFRPHLFSNGFPVALAMTILAGFVIGWLWGVQEANAMALPAGPIP